MKDNYAYLGRWFGTRVHQPARPEFVALASVMASSSVWNLKHAKQVGGPQISACITIVRQYPLGNRVLH